MSLQHEPLLEEENRGEFDDDILKLPWTSKAATRITWLAVLAITAILATSYLLLLKTHYLRLTAHSSINSVPPLSCGNTTAQARSLGCKFDSMSFSWLSPHCYDAELTSEFLSLQPWRWYSSSELATISSSNSTREIQEEEVLEGEHEYLFVSWEYHRLHCTYMWKKLHRAILSGGRVDSYIGNYNHTIHCERVWMRNGVGEEGLTVTRRKFVECPLS